MHAAKVNQSDVCFRSMFPGTFVVINMTSLHCLASESSLRQPQDCRAGLSILETARSSKAKMLLMHCQHMYLQWCPMLDLLVITAKLYNSDF